MIEHLEREGAEAIAQILGDRLTNASLPEDLRVFMDRVINPEHPAEIGTLAGVLAGIGWILASAALAGPASQLQTVSMRDHGYLPVEPGAAWDAAARRRIGRDVAAAWARDNGISSDVSETMIDASMGTLPPSTIMELWRQRKIDDGTVDDMLGKNGLDVNAIDGFKRLREGPIDLGTAVAAVTQSQITMAQFAELLSMAGISPSWADVIFKTAGQSPPVEMTLELWNRKLIGEEIVNKIVLESPLKNEYVDVIKLMRHKFPALEQTTTLMRRGIFTPAEGIDAIEKLGYTPELARKMAEYATAEKHAATKELSAAQTIALYDEQLLDRGAASADLVALGYDATESELLLKLAESRRSRRRQAQAVNRVHTKYVTFKIDESEATAALDALRVPTTARQDYLDTWEIERDISSLHLSRVDLKKAVKMGALTADRAALELRAMGYDEIWIPILRAIDGYDAPADT